MPMLSSCPLSVHRATFNFALSLAVGVVGGGVGARHSSQARHGTGGMTKRSHKHSTIYGQAADCHPERNKLSFLCKTQGA